MTTKIRRGVRTVRCDWPDCDAMNITRDTEAWRVGKRKESHVCPRHRRILNIMAKRSGA